MPQEIELKLAALPKDARRLTAAPLLQELAVEPWRVQRLRTTYFDTADYALWQRGLALRVRHVGRKRIQTLKIPQDAGDALQTCREHEARIRADIPDPAVLPMDDTVAALRAEGAFDRLEPLFTTVMRRRSRLVRLEDAEIEIAVDVGTLTAGERSAPICEVELEIKSGPAIRLYDLALALLDVAPFRLEARSKAARGFALVRAEPPPVPARAKSAHLKPGMDAGAALAALARNCVDQLRANEAVLLVGGDPEGVHQMRVALRRLRALLATFKSVLAEEPYNFLRGELRWLQHALGPAREWDVFLDDTIDRLVQRLPGEPGLPELREHARGARDAAYAAARGAVSSARYTALLLRLERWMADGGWATAAGDGNVGADTPVDVLADRVLARYDRRLRRVGKKHAELSLNDLHDVRIRAKKLRYAVEFFRDLYAKRMPKRYARALAEIQDALGGITDTIGAERLLDALDAQAGRGDGPPAGRAAAIVTGWEAARAEIGLARFPDVWRTYRKSKPFWDA